MKYIANGCAVEATSTNEMDDGEPEEEIYEIFCPTQSINLNGILLFYQN